MGFFSGPSVKERPNTDAFNLKGTLLGQSYFNPYEEGENIIQSNLARPLAPFVNRAGQLAKVGNVQQQSNVLQGLLTQGGQQAQLARNLQAEATRATPGAEFKALQRLVAPLQERERVQQEARLFAQGRLGTTGGAQEQEALRTAQGRTRLQQAVQAITGSRQQAAQARSQANQALQTALGLTKAGIEGQTGLQQTGLQNILGISQQQLEQLQTAGALSGLNAQASGGGGVGGALGGLAGGALGSFAGPLGTAAGSAIGSKIFGGETEGG